MSGGQDPDQWSDFAEPRPIVTTFCPRCGQRTADSHPRHPTYDELRAAVICLVADKSTSGVYTIPHARLSVALREDDASVVSGPDGMRVVVDMGS
jgi:hypothetical protein